MSKTPRTPPCPLLLSRCQRRHWSGESRNNQLGGNLYHPGSEPGPVQYHRSGAGFKTLTRDGIILEVAQRARLDVTLEVGPVDEKITVTSEATLVNGTDASVGTVTNRTFIENLPMNGRSFQSLIDLTPGVVLTKAAAQSEGQFSVNGQRSDSNYYTVDGVGANIGVSGGSALIQSAGGALPATTTLGGLNNLVSVDALQEFAYKRPRLRRNMVGSQALRFRFLPAPEPTNFMDSLPITSATRFSMRTTGSRTARGSRARPSSRTITISCWVGRCGFRTSTMGVIEPSSSSPTKVCVYCNR